MAPCDYFDFVILCVLALGTLAGLFWGFVSILTFLLATIAGVCVSRACSLGLANALGFEHVVGRGIVAFALFALTSLAVYLAASFLKRAVSRLRLHAWDAILGVFAGFFLSIALGWGISWAVCIFEEYRPLVDLSRSGKYFDAIATLHSSDTGVLPIEEPRWLMVEGEEPNAGVHRFLDSLDENLRSWFFGG